MEKKGQTLVLNGEPVTSTVQLGGFGVKRIDTDCQPCVIQIIDSAGFAVTDEVELRTAGETGRAVWLPPVIEYEIRRLRSDGKNAPIGELRRWASGIYLYVGKDNLLALSPEQPQRNAIVDPKSIVNIVWPQLRTSMMLDLDQKRPRAVFGAPFRHSSPLLPTESSEIDVSELRVGSHAWPGTAVFLLPLGHGMEAHSASVQMRASQFVDELQAAVPLPKAPVIEHDTIQQIPGMTSSKMVTMGDYDFYLAVLKKIPPARYFGLPAIAAWALFAWAIALLFLRSGEDTDFFIRVSGISLVVWCLSCIRMTLAYRYALNPISLDPLAISGINLSLLFWIIVPALPCAIAAGISALRSQETERWERLVATFFPIAQGAIAIILLRAFAHGQWPDLPQRYFRISGLLLLLLIAGAVILAGLAFIVYGPYSTIGKFTEKVAIFRRRGDRIGIRLSQFRLLSFWAASPFRPSKYWEQTPVFGKLGRWRFLTHILKWGIYLAGIALVLLACGGFGSIGRSIQQILTPLLFYLPVICWWLGIRTREVGFHEIGWGPAVLCLFLLVASPMLLIYSMGDPGGVVAVLALFVPLVLMLWRKPLWAARMIAVALLVAVVLLAGIAQAGLGGGAFGNRLLVFRKGIASQENVWYGVAAQQQQPSWTSRLKAKLKGQPIRSRSGAGPAILLANAEQHLWSNGAWAYEGGLVGTGFGNSPSRLSDVPQDTLQADSAYSFFIANEYGVLGGTALLLLYLVLVLFAIRFAGRTLRWGDALAVVLLGSIFLEAAVHVLMNLGWLPFTGRDLPLLSVNSGSDFVRPLIFLIVAVIGITSDMYAEFLEPRGARAGRLLRGFIAVVSGLIILWPAIDLSWVQLARKENYPVHDFSEGLQRLQEQLDDPDEEKHPVQWDEKKNALKATDSRKDTYLAQEIARFNEMPEEQRLLGGTGSIQTETFLRELAPVSNRDDYLKLLRKYEQTTEERSEPTLFVVHPPDAYADVAGEVPVDLFEPPAISVNPAFNRVTIARRIQNPALLPHLSLAGQQRGTWHVHGDGFDVSFPDRDFHPDKTQPNAGIERANVNIGGTGIATGSGALHSSWVELRMRCSSLSGRHQPGEIAHFMVIDGGLTFVPEGIKWTIEHSNSPQRSLRNLASKAVVAGDKIISAQSFCGGHQTLTIGHTREGSLIGPAWIMGEYRTTFQPNTAIPWLSLLRTALEIQQLKGTKGTAAPPAELTLDLDLQTAAQQFLTRKGTPIHDSVIRSIGPLTVSRDNYTRIQEKSPPRVGIAILNLSGGEVLALGGWPRVSSQDAWDDNPKDVLPPSRWIDQHAPRFLARHYEGDRNFERLVVGSASKPIWAAAALLTNPHLANLWVRGKEGITRERKVFDIDVSRGGDGFKVSDSSAWCNLDCYLARSDNRYQVTLNFSAFAQNGGEEHNGGIKTDSGLPGWTYESFDGHTPWQMMPDFGNIGFSAHDTPRTLLLDRQPLAHALARRFGVYVTRRPRREFRFSFWTADEKDDPSHEIDSVVGKSNVPDSLPSTYRVITPNATNLELDTITYPRQLVSVLLGGQTNLWSNVELAGAFATAATGRPVLPHIVPASQVQTIRESDTANAAILRVGLAQVVTIPTNQTNYHHTAGDLRQLQAFAAENHLRLFAKTGTLDVGPNSKNHEMSRFLLVMIPESVDGTFHKGLVFAFFIERAEHAGVAARHWAQEFILENKSLLLPYLR